MTFSRECEYALKGMVALAAEGGARRGYTLVRPASAITLREALEAIEGPDVFERCVFSHRHCSTDRPCQVHDVWREARPHVRAVFERTTLQDLVETAGAAGPLSANRGGRRRWR